MRLVLQAQAMDVRCSQHQHHAGKFLLINYDEKWMWRFVLRKYAKAVPELGVEQHDFSTYSTTGITSNRSCELL